MALVQRAASLRILQRSGEPFSKVPATYRTGRLLPVTACCIHSDTAITVPKYLISARQIELAFAELELKSLQEQVKGCRIRQHVNPLKASLMAPVTPPRWEEIWPDCSLPLTVDIGCGSGRFLMVLAKRNGGENFLGIDVRAKLVDRAKLWAEELKLSNAHFLTANATMQLDTLLSTYPGPLRYVTILCPDPHFKKRHQKRRLVQPQFVETLIKRLAPGGKIFIQSDVKEVAMDMRQQFDEHLGGALANCTSCERDSQGWVIENPLGLPSEREVHVLTLGGSVYRCLYQKLQPQLN